MITKSSNKCRIDRFTGEVEDEYAIDVGFHKVEIKHLADMLMNMSPKSVQVCLYILSNMNRRNQIIFSYEKLEIELSLSHPTVVKAVRELKDADLIRKGDAGYLVNPSIVFWGSAKRRMIAQKQFQNSSKN